MTEGLHLISTSPGEALGMQAHELVAIIGGGGKTTLMLALADDRRQAGCRVVTSTTTKVWHKEARRAPGVILTCSPGWQEALRHGLQKRGGMFVGRALLESGKVAGISPAMAGVLFRLPLVDHVILEADGAAGRPLKAPAAHEPVIPDSATLVVAVTGLEVLGKELNQEWVFRPELFAAATGLEPGDRLTPLRLARIYHAPQGLFQGTPAEARKVVFLNKLETLASMDEAHLLAREILQGGTGDIERVVMGSIRDRRFHIFKRRGA